MTIGPKIPGAVIPRRVFTQPGSEREPAPHGLCRRRGSKLVAITTKPIATDRSGRRHFRPRGREVGCREFARASLRPPARPCRKTSWAAARSPCGNRQSRGHPYPDPGGGRPPLPLWRVPSSQAQSRGRPRDRRDAERGQFTTVCLRNLCLRHARRGTICPQRPISLVWRRSAALKVATAWACSRHPAVAAQGARLHFRTLESP